MKKELVTVLMPFYNAEKYVSDAIKSVLEQTYDYFEFIIVDDGSNDRSKSIVHSFNDERVVLIENDSNKGVAEARNLALRIANGRWVAVIDADDVWLPRRLEKLINMLNNDIQNFFIADNQLLCFDSSEGLKPWRPLINNKTGIVFDNNISILSLSDYIRFGTPGIHPIFPLKPIKENGLIYNRKYEPSEDFEFHCNIFRIGLKLILLNESYYLYRLSPDSVTSKEPKESGLIAIKDLIMKDSFSKEDLKVLSIHKLKVEREFKYKTFAYNLRKKKFLRAFKLGFNNPIVIALLILRIPLSLKYRLKASILGGYIK